MADNNWTIIGFIAGAYGMISGALTWLLGHSKEHVCKNDIDKLKDKVVYRDTCQAVQEQQKERYETLLREIHLTQELIKNNSK